MRPIDADALIEDIRKHSESYFADDFAHEWVDRQSTIDAVSVIRCKDCVMYAEGKRADGHWCRGRKVKINGYCDLAERKDVPKTKSMRQ